MRADTRLVVLTGLVLAAALFPRVQAADEATPLPGMTYDSIRSLPDFSGAWSLKPPIPDPPQNLMRPEVAATLKVWSAKTVRGVDPADADGLKRSYCAPPKFAGFNGGLQDYVEFLFTPGRVTITNELGLIRRIGLTREPLPAGGEPSNAGASVGHWEGQTLVVETAALDPGIGVGEPIRKLPIKMGRNVRIVERISLKDDGSLQIVSRTTAPDVYTSPYEATTVYLRDRKHKFQDITNCTERDRAFDGATGRERFDMTPPSDLPPPPSK
ncbi:MAG TPA: hypothetical protein VGM84_09590 [Steroidobacteraceae bacterium]|jgi:hypothetical protein